MQPQLQREGTISEYIFICTVKNYYQSPSVTIKEMVGSGYSRSMVTKYLAKLIKMGWAFKISKNRYILKSYKSIIEERGLNSEYCKMFAGDTNTELKTLAMLDIISHKINRATLGSDYRKKESKKRKKGVSIQVQQGCSNTFDSSVGISVRLASKMAGFKSPITGSKLLGRLEKYGFIKRKKNNFLLCPLSELHRYAYEEIAPRMFVKNGNVYVREMSSMVLTGKKDHDFYDKGRR